MKLGRLGFENKRDANARIFGNGLIQLELALILVQDRKVAREEPQVRISLTHSKFYEVLSQFAWGKQLAELNLSWSRVNLDGGYKPGALYSPT